MAVKLSVIVPCHGHVIELDACLQALMLQQTDVDYEVIVVDSSSDPRIETIASQYTGIRLICSQRRLFPGGARNLGVRHAASDQLAFTDADCIPDPQWVETAYRSLDDKYAMVSGPVLDVKPIHPIAWVDNRCQYSDFHNKHLALKIKHAPTCNLVLSKKTWEMVNGFREDLVTGEDGVLTSDPQVQEKGIRFNPSLRVQHHGRKTLRAFMEHQCMFGYYRGLIGLFVSKSLEFTGANPILMWTIIPRRLIYFGLRILQFDPMGLPRFILSLPLFLIGLTVWTLGFHNGITQRRKENR